MSDLWPEDVGQGSVLDAPVSILKEQAALLGQKTDNVVEAKVEVVRTGVGDFLDHDFRYDFWIVAAALGPYQFRIFRIGHQVDLYPVNISVDRDIHEEIAPDTRPYLRSDSPDDFRELLRQIFGAEKTKSIINALVAQSRSV